jgi:YD repeat-containing protein
VRGALALFGALIVSCCASVAQAQNPDTQRGLKPGLAYKLEGLDNFNIFNGTMNLTIPLGQTYPVGGTLSYSFMASYATNPWETGYNESDYGAVELPDDPMAPMEFTSYQFPSPQSNAGLGWSVTLGHIFEHPEGGFGTFYIAPDGGQHRIDQYMHGFPRGMQSDVVGTTDGTYIRRRGRQLDFPNGNVHTFDSKGRLTRMEDRFGNWVAVTYLEEDSPYAEGGKRTVQKVEDSAGRVHRVYYRKSWSYYEYVWEDLTEAQWRIPHEVVDKIQLAAFGDTTAEYKFSYDAAYDHTVNDANNAPAVTALTTSRPCAPRHDAMTAEYVYVPVLASIAMPEGVTYSFTTDRGDKVTCKSVFQGSITGNLTQMKLPTGAVVDWTYQPYAFPALSAQKNEKHYLSTSMNPGIKQRVLKSGTGDILSRTEYSWSRVGDATSYTWDDMYRVVKNFEKNDVLLNATAHYFSACRNPFGCPDRYNGEYGLPFSRQKGSAGEGFVSTETLVPNAAGELVPKRTTYLGYEGDVGLEVTAINARVRYERTAYEDGKYTEVKYSNHDGLGHYRRVTTGGNFERANQRVTFTNYNPAVGTFEYENGVFNSKYKLPAEWILGTFDREWTSETLWSSAGVGSLQVSDVTVCFDSLGFQTSRRIHSATRSSESGAPTISADDLLAIFVRDGSGNLASERYYGGASAPDYKCNAAPPANPTYRIDHSYAYGTRAASWYADALGATLGFFTADLEIDKNTGGVHKSHQARTSETSTDGVTTTYGYDKLGRLTSTETRNSGVSSTGPATLKTTHAYSLSPVSIISTSADAKDTVVGRTEMHFDGVGRVVREVRSMPADGTAQKYITYNGLGWVTKVIDWGASAATLTSYDAFGRPTLVKPPDVAAADATQIEYTGVAQIRRSSMVKTDGTAAAPILTRAETKEDYDRFGRLIRVTEPPQSSENPAKTVTEYFYDAAGRLVEVCANLTVSGCGQKRAFKYDGRGLLTKESHPESADIFYPSYDARGHALRRKIADGEFDLSFTFDRAERMTGVDETVGKTTRALKRFTFFSTNAASKASNGQIQEAVRYNWLSDQRGVKIAESYQYDAAGRVSSRTTKDYHCATNCTAAASVWTAQNRFDQAFEYDALGNPTKLAAPTLCPAAGCAAALATAVTNTYDRGRLTGVAWAGGQTSIAYHGSGLVSSVTHGNKVVDDVEVDPAVPGRPLRMVTKATVKSACAPPSFTKHPTSVTIATGTSTKLEALATGETNKTISYVWYSGTSSSRTVVGSGTTFTTPNLTSTTNYWVEATNGCGTAATASQTATVTVCMPAKISDSSRNKSITRGQTAKLVLWADAASSTPLSYQWYKKGAVINSPIADASSDIIFVTPTETTTYIGEVKNACGTARKEIVVTVSAKATSPSAVTAEYRPDLGGVRISWGESSSDAGIGGYLVERRPGDISFSTSADARTVVDQSVVNGVAYTYTVRALDTNGAYSSATPGDFATVVTFPVAITVSETRVDDAHVSELRKAVAAVRTLAGLGPAWTSNELAAEEFITSAHFTDLRDALNQARVALGFSSVVFTESAANGALIRASVVRELREGVR